MYTIKQAAARTGVAIATLRAWERRYGIVAPTRTASGYRLYDDDALVRLASMRRLVDSGWTASNAARAVIDGSAEVAGDRPLATPAVEDDPRSGLVDRFLAAAAAIDAPAVEATLDEMFASGSFERVAEALLLPALVGLGDAWADGRVSVAAEHAASLAVQRRLAAAFQAAGTPVAWRAAVLVGLPPGARHELGALAFGVAARRAGLPVLYLGPDLPVVDWVRTAAGTGAAAAVIGAISSDDAGPAAAVADALAAAAPNLVIAFGGKSAPRATATAGYGRPIVLPDRLSEAVQVLAAALQDRAG